MHRKEVFLKYLFLLGLALSTAYGSYSLFNFSFSQGFSLVVFIVSVMGALLFWEFRLSFALLGSALLIIFKIVDLEKFLFFSSLEIILFLIGMMILLGNLKEMGFFDWSLSKLLKIRALTARKLLFIIIFLSALSSCLMGEVSSIIFIIVFIFSIADYFEVEPWPYVLIAVLATNIGSTGTVLGNPVGILIATKVGLHFEDFLKHSFILMIVLLFLFYFVSLFLFRKHLKFLDRQIKKLGPSEMFSQLVIIPVDFNLKVSVLFFISTILIIAFHYRIELLLGLKENTILLISPLVISGILIIWRRKKARLYIERDVEWWTILFFLFLFAQAGVLQHTGVAKTFASYFYNIIAGNRMVFIIAVILFTSLFSGLVDNVVVVAAFIPIIKEVLVFHPEFSGVCWWALLYGACLGGNFTHIGSTANIVALGILEKEKATKIGLRRWLVFGFSSTILLLFLTFVVFYLLPWYK